MAVMKAGRMYGDPTPAFVCQVIEHINNNPPVRPCEIGHCCFPIYMRDCADQDEWIRRFPDLEAEVDQRMQVLHNANFVWRREIKNRDPLVQAKEPIYYRRNDRRKIVQLSDEVLWLPFHEIKPFKDERFPIFD
jgi:hypothetical protein